MEVLNQNQTSQIHGGNLMIPGIACIGIGFCSGLVAWAIKTVYRDEEEAFSSVGNYILEGSIGAGIGALATLGFILAA